MATHVRSKIIDKKTTKKKIDNLELNETVGMLANPNKVICHGPDRRNNLRVTQDRF